MHVAAAGLIATLIWSGLMLFATDRLAMLIFAPIVISALVFVLCAVPLTLPRRTVNRSARS